MVDGAAAASAESVAPLLGESSESRQEEDFVYVEGVVDYKGRPVNKSKYGGWRSASFIIGVEIAERFAYYGISSNLITYLTDHLHQSTATAAQNINVWSGFVSMLPLVGAFVADSYLGQYRTILFSSLLYVLALGLLTLSVLLPFPSSLDCPDNENNTPCSSPSILQVVVFFFSLYLVAVAQSGHRPCVQAFGADQFDDQDPVESKSKSSFFNWLYFGLCAGVTVTLCVVNYIQDNLNWGLGFGIPCLSMAVALAVFLLGTNTYRYNFREDEKSPFVRIAQVFLAAARNRRTSTSSLIVLEESKTTSDHQFKFLDKALTTESVNSVDFGEMCSNSYLEHRSCADVIFNHDEKNGDSNGMETVFMIPEILVLYQD
ncbi:NRT1/ PTR FAMILY 5.10 [Thalictrum thalictroides]|uniref:NRT1/ PTR FAMILY 5.10 n=1 Tax=Thalictrum thalictroides TaxID=46969 RepID=A0A7J6VSY1_THATH|nr:NRT1/ PTR FAMILY 5.10 [Thalictrum thalictroides]